MSRGAKLLNLSPAKTKRSEPVRRAHRPDYWLLAVMLGLMTFGIVMSVTVGVRRAAYLNNAGWAGFDDGFFFFWDQIRAVVMGLIGFFVALKLPVKSFWLKFAFYLLIGALALNVVLSIAALSSGGVSGPLVHCSRGACRWMRIGGMTIQPAELLKLALTVFLAMFFAKRNETEGVNNLKTAIWVSAISGFSLILVVIAQNDLGSGLTIASITLVMWLLAGLKIRYVAILAALGVALVVFMSVVTPFRMRRVNTYLDTVRSPVAILENHSDDAWQLRQAMIAIGSGGVLGVGAGNAVQATSYLPEPLSDAVFAAIGEVFGMIGSLIVLILYGLLAWRFFYIHNRLDSDFDRLVVIGAFAWIVGQALINIMALTALIPLTGVNLPFISSGGTSMLASAAMLGLVFQMSKYTRREE
ncbi:FtsW/RodA/SpoVE family cell cycle protein [Candidatus Saccharibacteria bacterium]|nr:FtsW/RodA/SpoVE family cell cycle protein [Candidatus Saccharibacteria bacterium]